MSEEITISFTCNIYQANLLMALYDISSHQWKCHTDVEPTTVDFVPCILDEIVVSVPMMVDMADEFGKREAFLKSLSSKRKSFGEAVIAKAEE